ncbi:hypothetical protein RclHR1_09820001 [Rhizophagus clarus]|uniref:Uncharacterized protein n=1 Tax=Rhizophagus clarus TaxID=94130 RepID=A0A2Z6SJ99_9GLOM|nr:hypothetical protein RclHR1_09820001 [Rhizophagus clarus]
MSKDNPEHRRSETPFRDGSLSPELHFEADHCNLETPLRGGLLSGTPFQDRPIQVQNLKADWYFEDPEVLYRQTTVNLEEVDRVISKVQNSNLKQTVFGRSRPWSRTRSELKMDPILRQTRFASFWRSSRGIRSHRLSRRLLDEFQRLKFQKILV